MSDKNLDMARRIAGAVAAAGGRTFFVGGFVRDGLMGEGGKDVDIEVHGVPLAGLRAILDGLGERTEMGASFGVLGLRHYAVDIALPRSERATGRGHRDFEVSVDPFIGPERAARRRDFTINAMMRDVLTGELLDFFGGQADLARGVLRHVSDDTFPEDPLRAFRAAQFAARFGFEVAAETRALCARMDVTALPPERVMGELEKALIKAERPSAFFAELGAMALLDDWFGELAALDDGARRRALDALDGAAVLRDGVSHPVAFELAALLWPLDGECARWLLSRLTGEVALTRYALDMSGRCRRAPEALAAGEGAWMRLLDGAACPGDLPALVRACGLDPEGALAAALEVYERRMARPFVQGRDLVAAGVRPGPRMGEALAAAHALRLDGAPKEAQLRAALDCVARNERGTDRA